MKKSESGQAVLEYILLLAIVLGSLGFMVRFLRDRTDQMAAKSGAKMEKMLRTGSAAPERWTR